MKMKKNSKDPRKYDEAWKKKFKLHRYENRGKEKKHEKKNV